MRLRVRVDDYDSHPPVPPGTVVNLLGDPDNPWLLVIELDSPLEVKGPNGARVVKIRHIGVSGYGWEFRELIHPPRKPSLWFVKIWHVYDPRLAEATEWSQEALRYVAKGGMTRFIPTDEAKKREGLGYRP